MVPGLVVWLVVSLVVCGSMVAVVVWSVVTPVVSGYYDRLLVSVVTLLVVWSVITLVVRGHSGGQY